MRALPVLLFSALATGGEIYTAQVTQQGERYTVLVDAQVATEISRVRQLLTDYANLGRVNPAVEVSEILRRQSAHQYRVRTVTRACVWFFCKHIEQVQNVTEHDDGSVIAVVEPQHSDLRHGVARLDLSALQNGTRVTIRAEVEPDFWIPPVIGPWALKRKLRSEALETVANLERAEYLRQPDDTALPAR